MRTAHPGARFAYIRNLFYLYRHAVYLHPGVGGYEDIFPAVFVPGLYEMAELGVQAYLYLLGLHGHLSAVADAGGDHLGILAQPLVAAAHKGLGLLRGAAALFQHFSHFMGGEAEHLRGTALLVGAYPVAELLVQVLHHFKIAPGVHGVAEKLVKAVLLLRRRHGRREVEHGAYKGPVVLFGVAAVEKGPVDIGAAVVKGGVHEAQYGSGDHLAYYGVVETLVLMVVRLPLNTFPNVLNQNHAESKSQYRCTKHIQPDTIQSKVPERTKHNNREHKCYAH